ncbi:GNAT family N-acetyltransferase [Ferrimonas aestuarii]|uniref:GNAT family N-acetyltransferase n=1 Tax=Ferrimonas aestuarii TaxID=2569539 RepID=A0A4U1BT82_9GAMM|nr:GNAT family N-acetyltransferase [Ferrimonas aestuarii]TKB58392.1 GNAT family N-acetyltransferase [Ferrimonas aestuarii]
MTHPLTIQHFFNSVLIETGLGQVSQQILRLPLDKERELQLPLSYVSPSGRHRYQGEIGLMLTPNGQPQRIEFAEAAKALVDAHFSDIDDHKRRKFLERVQQSDRYVARADLAVADRHDIDVNRSGFIASEQQLSGGHSMHPAPKCNEPLNDIQQANYLPEFAGQFPLHWFAVKGSHLVGESAAGELATELLALFEHCTDAQVNELPETNPLTQGYLPLPMHPLQADAWREFASQTPWTDAAVIDLKLTSSGWTATSSSRAIYHPDCPWMIKVSLPVRLTNSLRTMSAKEAQRGTQFSALMATEAGEQMRQRLPNTYLLQEPLWCSIQTPQGEILDLPLVSLRDNPFHQDHTSRLDPKRFHMLATLNQSKPQGNGSQLADHLQRYANQLHNVNDDSPLSAIAKQQAALNWMQAFLQQVITPLCIARSDYGIVMLAHQQNLMVEMEQDLPVGVAIRDCQGFGLTTLAKRRFAEVFEHQPPHYYMESDELNPYHAYYVVGNTLLNSIAAIAAAGFISEAKLWAQCRDHFDALAQRHPQDDSFYRYLLDSPTLRWKRNFLCFLADFNEATLENPAQIYCDIPNPLQWPAERSGQQRIHKPLPDNRQITLVQSLDSRSDFALYEQGQHQASFIAKESAAKQWQLTALDSDLSDPMLWWSAAEHLFGSFDAQKVVMPQWPEGEKSLSKPEFLQQSPLWLCTAKDTGDIEMVSADNGCRHPKRPAHPRGVMFQRYYYHLKRTLTLRVIELERDLPCFHRWQNNPEVAAMWELEGSLTLHRDYLNAQKQDRHAYGVIGEFDGVPFGYFEIYWAAEDRIGPFYDHGLFDTGVHMLVGNMAFRGGSYFDVWARSIVQYCFQRAPRMAAVVGEPRADNPRVQMLNARIGLEKQFEFDFPHKRAALILCGRERFFNQFAF